MTTLFLDFFGVTFPAGAVVVELPDFPSLLDLAGFKVSGLTVPFPCPESVFLILVAAPVLAPGESRTLPGLAVKIDCPALEALYFR